MKLVNKIADVRQSISNWRAQGLTIGFVPTMGYLHEGHQSLMEAAKKKNDRIVVSIFVNPLQFGPNEDLASYPRDLERDASLCAACGVDLIFAPTVSEMYPAGFNTYVEAFGVTEKLEGAKRPAHFKGVTTVVTKLLNIVTPDDAFFGQKDAQQVAVVRQLVQDLNIPVKIHPCPIIREQDGLAKSSRNSYLSPAERKAAICLSEALAVAKELYQGHEQRAEAIIAAMEQKISEYPVAKIDYLQLVDGISLEELDHIADTDEILVLLAVFIGRTRLIDNALIRR